MTDGDLDNLIIALKTQRDVWCERGGEFDAILYAKAANALTELRAERDRWYAAYTRETRISNGYARIVRELGVEAMVDEERGAIYLADVSDLGGICRHVRPDAYCMECTDPRHKIETLRSENPLLLDEKVTHDKRRAAVLKVLPEGQQR